MNKLDVSLCFTFFTLVNCSMQQIFGCYTFFVSKVLRMMALFRLRKSWVGQYFYYKKNSMSISTLTGCSCIIGRREKPRPLFCGKTWMLFPILRCIFYIPVPDKDFLQTLNFFFVDLGLFFEFFLLLFQPFGATTVKFVEFCSHPMM